MSHNRAAVQLRLAKMPVSNLPPRYNVAPTQTYEIVYRDAQGERVMEPCRWGLIPTFMRDRKSAARCINARAETIATLPSFRSAFGKRRCLVPASGYYEWKVIGPKTKQPYAIAATNADDMLVFAGLWETWTDPETQEVVRTYSIATTEPGPDVRGGPGCLNSFSASISGASAGVRLPSGEAAT